MMVCWLFVLLLRPTTGGRLGSAPPDSESNMVSIGFCSFPRSVAGEPGDSWTPSGVVAIADAAAVVAGSGVVGDLGDVDSGLSASSNDERLRRNLNRRASDPPGVPAPFGVRVDAEVCVELDAGLATRSGGAEGGSPSDDRPECLNGTGLDRLRGSGGRCEFPVPFEARRFPRKRVRKVPGGG